MSGKDIPSAYDPKQTESRIYDYWMRGGYFHAEPDPSMERFIIMMPPPNITGTLHLGHALDNTIQDLLIRFNRMRGRNTCWIPGTDHASIATEAKVVAALSKEGKTKGDLGRDEFINHAWKWKREYGGAIVDQLKKLGCSPDWERERFTMDETCSRAVREVFVQLYEKGLIYRGDRMVNWCPDCNTSISDVEVEHEEAESNLWHLSYPLKDGSGCMIVATTRPETMLGDTAVAVNPTDERYRALVGRTVVLPIMNREIPIIADDYADPEFGSGAVKVTPGHDPNDFEIGLRHGLPVIKVIGPDGRMTEEAGKYAGMTREECRKAVVEELKGSGSLVKIESHMHSLGHCQRCGTTVEPLVSRQWFVRMEPLAIPAVQAVKDGRIKFVPDRFAKTYLNWMENVRDWCISRQLWWGHRIPVWYCQDCGHMFASRVDPDGCELCNGRVDQDPDVLDTWFSSALWPFSTLGWPERTPELEHWYPTSVLVTGYDIIFFWVARMIFMGLEFMGERPFHTVLLHGLIRNADGSKMSRSKGTGVNPLDIIDAHGADTLRFTVLTGNTPGNDMRWYQEKVEASRNFANKVWNASRFVMMNLDGYDPEAMVKDHVYTLADRWMMSRFGQVASEVTAHLDRFDLGEAARTVYEFIWGEYCDWYIEAVKPRLYGKETPESRLAAQHVLYTVLDGALKLLHPFMPFITEGIWQHLPGSAGSIMVQPWPVQEYRDPEACEDMAAIMDLVRTIRNIRAEFGVIPSKKVEAVFHADEKGCRFLQSEMNLISNLAGVGAYTISGADAAKPEKAAAGVAAGIEVYLPLAGMVDLDKEIDRLSKEAASLEKDLAAVAAKLANEAFVSRAPAQVVDGERTRMADLQTSLAAIRRRLGELKS